MSTDVRLESDLVAWLSRIAENVTVRCESTLAAHVAAVALHAALLAVISGYAPYAPSVRIFHSYDRVILDSGKRSAWVVHKMNDETVDINLHGGVPTRGLKINWTPRTLDVDRIIREATRQAERVGQHLCWWDEEGV